MPIKATFTGDVSDLRRATQQASTEFRKVGEQAQGAARQLQAVGSKFDGSRIEGQAQRIARGIERIGGAARLSDSELKSAQRGLDDYIQKAARMGAEVPANIQKIANELRALDAQQKAATSSAQQLGQASSGIGASLKSGAGALAAGLGVGLGAGAGLAAITAIGSGLRDMAEQGAKLGPLSQSFEKLQGGAANARVTLEAMRSATRGLVSEIDLMRQANQASQLNLTALGVRMDDLAGVATTLGRAVGVDATAAIDALIGAIGRGSIEVLDNLGVTLKLSEAYEIYADRLGKSADKLTDQEKKQAFVTIAMERAKEAADKLGTQQLTVLEQAGRIATAFGDIGAKAFSAGNETTTLAGALGKVADSLERIRNARPGEVADIIAADMARAGRDIEQSIEGLINRLPWYLRSLAELGAAPIRLSNLAVSQVAPLVGNTSGVSPATLRPQASHLLPMALVPSHGGAPAAPAARTAPTKEQLAAIQKWNEEIAELTGAKTVADGKRLADQLLQIAAAGKRIASDNIEAVAQRLITARRAADQTSAAFREMGRALNTLPIASTPGPGFVGLNRAVTSQTAAIPGMLPSTNPTAGMLIGLAPAIQPAIRKTTQETRNLALEVRNVAQAFAQLAQIAGPAMGNVTRGIGTAFAAADASSQLIEALSGAFPSLMTTNAQGQRVLSGRGRGLASALASAQTGMALGGMTSNPFLGGALGAGGGLATGLSLGLAGPTLGASVAIGGLTAAYSAWQNARAQQAALRQQRQAFVDAAGGASELRRQIEEAGLSWAYFQRGFNDDSPNEVAQAIRYVTGSLAALERQASQLGREMQEVARVQGVLSPEQFQRMREVLGRGGEGAASVVEFAAQQRLQAEEGLATTIAALNQQASLTDQEIEDLTRGITDAAERQRVIEATLKRRATETLDRFGGVAQAAASGLFVAFNDAIRQGESALSILQRLAPSINTLRDLFAKGGITPGAGFQQLQVLSSIATDTTTGPIVSMAQGLGAALAGFANSGLLSPELFTELANGIGGAYKQLELMGKGGLEAARLMQPSLQAIWQMIQANPELEGTLDANTRALLDFARQNNLVGDQFRPPIDRMILKIDDLITKIGELIDKILVVPPINVPVNYIPGETPELPEPPTPPRPPPSSPRLPELAAGGIVTRPTHALIGEAGPEAVIPLSRLSALGGAITVITPVIIDGREVTRVVNRYQGDERRLMGVA